MIKFDFFLQEEKRFSVKFVKGLNFDFNSPLLEANKGMSLLYSVLKGYFSNQRIIVLLKLNYL